MHNLMLWHIAITTLFTLNICQLAKQSLVRDNIYSLISS